MFIVLLCCLIAVFAGCSDDDNPSNPGYTGPDVIMPLEVGFRWAGTQQTYDSLGNLRSSASQTFYVERDTIIPDTTYGDEHWFTLAGGTILLSNREDGTWARYGFSDTMDLQEPVIYLKYWAEPWETYLSGSYLGSTVTVVSTDSVVSVPAGSFKCYYYKWDRPDINRIDHYFLSPKLGWVKTEYYKPNLAGEFYLWSKWELESYILNVSP